MAILIIEEDIELNGIGGSEEHFVAPFEGDRFSVVLFPHHSMHLISQEQRSFLLSLGFQLEQPVVSLPSTPTLGSYIAPCVPVRGEKIFIVEFGAGLGPLSAAARLVGKRAQCYFFESNSDALDVLAKLPGEPQLLGGNCMDYTKLAKQLFAFTADHIILSYVSPQQIDMAVIIGIADAMCEFRSQRILRSGALIVTPALSENQMLASLEKEHGHVRLTWYNKNKQHTIRAHENMIACMVLNNEGRLIATASVKGTLIRLTNAQNGMVL